MSIEHCPSVHADRATWLLVGGGIVALAVAMGIGRFAFTPLMPLMLRDGTLSSAAGAEWAAANYAGYLFGALTASRFSNDPRLGLRVALWGVALSTMAIAWIDGRSATLAGAVLRAGAGVFSAWALICASSGYLATLARRQAAQQGAWIYTGVGLGIALAGVLAWLGGGQAARALWLELGLLALAGAILVSLQGRGIQAATAGMRAPLLAASGAPRGHLPLVLCYGTLGAGRWAGWDAFTVANAVASVLLVVTAAWLWQAHQQRSGDLPGREGDRHPGQQQRRIGRALLAGQLQAGHGRDP